MQSRSAAGCVATIHGLEQADGQQFIVMELVEGETLAERIERGPIPVPEALAIARQIANTTAVVRTRRDC